jgi:hypothetical protein
MESIDETVAEQYNDAQANIKNANKSFKYPNLKNVQSG